MKKHVIIATGAALLSTSAFATKARMEALGQDEVRGSQYLNDTRNKFRNAAHVNNMNNYVVTEWGTNANAEGGFFRDAGALAYGLYFGAEDVNTVAAADRLDGNQGFQGQTNRLDLFVGGDAGVQWGLRVDYSNDENKAQETKTESMGLGLGVIHGSLSGYVNLSLKDDAKGNFLDITANPQTLTDVNDKYEGSNMNAGLAYGWNNWTFHADYAKVGGDVIDASASTTTEGTVSTITVGAAQVHEISSTAMVFTAVDYVNQKDEEKAAAGTDEEKTNKLVATIGFEADATSWLTWRGSVSQNVFIGSTETTGVTPVKEASLRDSTEVNAGATLTFGKLMVDGRIGTTTAGNLSLDEVLADVAVSYWF